jgi:hypothetical protein
MLNYRSRKGKDEGVGVDQKGDCLPLAEFYFSKVIVVRHLVKGTLDQFLVACILRAR